MVIVGLVTLRVCVLLAVTVVVPGATPVKLAVAELRLPAVIIVLVGTVATPGALLVRLISKLETTVSLPA